MFVFLFCSRLQFRLAARTVAETNDIYTLDGEQAHAFEGNKREYDVAGGRRRGFDEISVHSLRSDLM